MSDVFATSFGVLNYSGMLFDKGNAETPFSSAIGGRAKTTNHVEFVTGQEYTSGGGQQPAISETASLTAPYATVITREQKTNVTQIFQYAVGISYAKQSNMGTLSGLNVASQTANPINELDFQVAQKIKECKNDIEYTFINGAYQKAANDSTANKTRGMIAAITSNVVDMGGAQLGIWDLALMLKLIKEGNAPIEGLVLWCDANTYMQINADAEANGMTVYEADRTVNGIRVSRVITPMGDILLRMGKYLPAGTALVLDFGVISPVYQPVPGKGNFFLEPLAKVGAGEKYQLFGQIGLDHGPEWYHGKFTGISTGFVAPKGRNVVVAGGIAGVVETTAVLSGAKLNKNEVAADDTAQVACNSLEYQPAAPGSAATLAYLWQKKESNGTTWTDLTSSYTGYNTATLTVKAADAGDSYRCKVTASGTALGTVYSDECVVASA